jgi:outer membrane protein assembly factor BamE (lipoprotein component of BamABCDE complex)
MLIMKSSIKIILAAIRSASLRGGQRLTWQSSLLHKVFTGYHAKTRSAGIKDLRLRRYYVARSDVFGWVLAAMVASSCLIGCSRVEQRHGLHPGIDVIVGLVPQVTKREEVLMKLGTPSFTSMYGEETWFYAYTALQQRQFSSPKAIDQHTYKLTFNSLGVLTAIIDIPLAEAPHHIKVVSDHTPAKGDDTGFTREVFGSLGKYNDREPKADGL